MATDEKPKDTTSTIDRGAGRADSFLEKLKNAAENLTNLQIVTVIGDVELSGEIERPQVKFARATTGADSVIVTNINLLDSDVTSVIPSKYESEITAPIMKYHTDQVTQANESMTAKLKLIQTLITDIVPKLRTTQPTPDIT